jgi:hypothetical protein
VCIAVVEGRKARKEEGMDQLGLVEAAHREEKAGLPVEAFHIPAEKSMEKRK